MTYTGERGGEFDTVGDSCHPISGADPTYFNPTSVPASTHSEVDAKCPNVVNGSEPSGCLGPHSPVVSRLKKSLSEIVEVVISNLLFDSFPIPVMKSPSGPHDGVPILLYDRLFLYHLSHWPVVSVLGLSLKPLPNDVDFPTSNPLLYTKLLYMCALGLGVVAGALVQLIPNNSLNAAMQFRIITCVFLISIHDGWLYQNFHPEPLGSLFP